MYLTCKEPLMKVPLKTLCIKPGVHDGTKVCCVSDILVGLLSVIPGTLPHPSELDTSICSYLNTGGLSRCNCLFHTLKKKID